ncbi:MAG: MBL fold metallo-hydrolase [Candidatus Omnitrophota bacterium]|nr:MBL fold metallo-hydrolase [Candidatus Omnitrophota bacterium]
MTENLHWLGHATFRWDGSKTVYFDPWNIPSASKKADIVLITHEHFDHFSKPDIAKISDEDTVVVAGEAVTCQLKAQRELLRDILTVSPGDSIDLSGVRIKAVASYNIGKSYHTKASKKMGFIVTIDGVSIYHAGDTDNIPEIKDVKCDIALLPVGGTYTMTAEEAAAAALAIKPKAAIPMHYGGTAGTPGDGKRFEEFLKGKVEVKILKREG